jgi:hypothetical protein
VRLASPVLQSRRKWACKEIMDGAAVQIMPL